MIDRIQYNLEQTAEELKDLLNKKIFTEEEIQEIIIKRKNYEYKIQRPQKKLSDFLRYLEYEINLENIKKAKKEEKKIKEDSLDLKNKRKIILIFKNALKHFYDERLFVQFIDYLEENNLVEEMKEYFSEICLLRFNDCDLWVYCGHKFFEKGEVDEGRVLMQKGLRIFKSFGFYSEYFKMEFLNFQRVLSINNELGIDTSDTELEDGAILIILFKEILLNYKNEDLNFIYQMIDNYKILKERITNLQNNN